MCEEYLNISLKILKEKAGAFEWLENNMKDITIYCDQGLWIIKPKIGKIYGNSLLEVIQIAKTVLKE